MKAGGSAQMQLYCRLEAAPGRGNREKTAVSSPKVGVPDQWSVWFGKPRQITSTWRSPTPSTWPCNLSPLTMAPTPDGVPVMMMSPAVNSNRLEM